MIYVSMDGPAPLARLPEQRARRQDAAVSSARRNTFDAQQITPGCTAMTTIESQVYSLLRELFFVSGGSGKRTAAGAFQSPDFSAIIDGSGVEGEGEYKIIRKVLNDHVERDALKGRVTRAILACDADLFLQALLSDVPHLYLFDPFAPYNSPNVIFSVDRWRRTLAADNSNATGRRMAFDFVLFALMSGSDYAPALKFANYRSLWPAYWDFMSEAESKAKRVKTIAEDEDGLCTTIVDPVGKSINLRVLRDFFAFYCENVLTETLREPLKMAHDELDPIGKDDRILNYMEHMIWNLDALVKCKASDLTISLETGKVAPSLLELADFDVEALQEKLAERLGKQNRAGNEESCKYPGVMALLALDRGTECQGYVSEPLRPLLQELKDPNSFLGQISRDSDLVKELTERIDSIPQDSFNLIEKLATFPRAPIQLTREIANTPESANFYTMALKAAAVGNGLDNAQLSPETGLSGNLPWMRPFVYAVEEEESWKCPLHRMLFGKYRNK